MPPVLDSVSVADLSTRASTVPGSWNEENRTVEVMWSTGAPYTRYSYGRGSFVETLEVSEDACDLTRLQAGASVLDDHNYWRGARGVLGVVEEAWIVNGEGRARIRFSDREEIADLVRDVSRGILHQFSVGYRVHRYEDVSETDSDVIRLHAVEWEPYELSLVSIPAEVGAGTRSAPAAGEPYAVPIRLRTMPPEFGQGVETPAAPGGTPSPAPAAPADSNRAAAPQAQAPVAPAPAPAAAPAPANQRSEQELMNAGAVAERERVAAIEQHGRALRLDANAIRSLVDTGRPLSELNQEIERHFEAANPDPVGEIRNTGVEIGTEDVTKRRAAATEALCARLMPGATPPEEAGEFRGRSLVDVVRLMEQMAGRNGLAMSMGDVQRRAFHTTGDLPYLLEEAGRRTLRAMFDLLPETFQPWTRTGTLRDFRQDNRIRVGDAPELEEVPDGADIKFGTIGEDNEPIKLLSYAKGVALGRRALINDDLAGFGRLIQAQALRVSDLVSNLVYEQLQNGKVGGKGLFDNSHNNKSTGVLSVASLGAAEAKMLKQKSSGGMPLSLMPKYLLVPTDLKALADQLTTVVNPSTATEVNQFAGRLQVIVEPRLDGGNPQWYLAADPARIDTVEVAWLEGNVGPQFDSAEVFENRGMKFSVWADVTAKSMDYRGLIRSSGSGS